MSLLTTRSKSCMYSHYFHLGDRPVRVVTESDSPQSHVVLVAVRNKHLRERLVTPDGRIGRRVIARLRSMPEPTPPPAHPDVIS